ncbi:MAG: dTDP-4-dehydrorhamnose reductase [Methanobacteriota archaeon]|nr:MAG: dTDP-4-dehydrorhamnose reductase [Euryarchaeota archaeon]
MPQPVKGNCGGIWLKKLLVIGASGLLGSKIVRIASEKFAVSGTYNPQVDGEDLWRLEALDLGSKDDVERLFFKVDPNAVILTAAMTNVDACEREPLVANRVNASGPMIVARACREHGARLVHVSTDYVFDGTKSRKYKETDVPRPISVYGSSKLTGEKAVLSTMPDAAVVRTAVLYGWNPIEGKDNFVTWVLKKLRSNEKVTLFDDQHISPTFADDLADALVGILQQGASGLFHVCGPDCINRVDSGMMIADAFGLDKNLIVPVRSEAVRLPARRPAYSCLDSSKAEKLLGRKLISLDAGLARMRELEDE